jgi:methionine-S-sulfoxide reductase
VVDLQRKATFGAGCFWGVEAAFRRVDGVTDTAVGYLGGTMDDPSYQDVCSGTTGHAEVVEVTYDHASDGRIRHGANVVRWRTDRDPSTCLLEQLDI